MTNAEPTEQELFAMTKEEVHSYISQSVGEQKETEGFHPDRYEPQNNPHLTHIRSLKGSYQVSHKQRVTYQAILIPSVIVIPTVAALSFRLPFETAAAWFVLSIIASLVYFFVTGKVSTYRTRKYQFVSEEGQKAAEKLAHVRADAWAKRTYILPTNETISWSRYSELTVNGKRSEWDEVADDTYILKVLETGEEFPRKS